jgi:predicted ferric reductase
MILGLAFLSNTVLVRFKLFQKLSDGTSKLITIRYHIAKAIHNITMIATIVLYFHLLVATATTYSVLLQIIYTIHFGIGFFFWINHKFIRKYRIRKHPYIITEVIQDSTLIWSLKIKPESGDIIRYQPGQYIYLTIIGKNVSKEPHPFTIASSPTENHLVLTIKESGDYSSNIGQVEVGDKAYIDGPYGIFKPLESEAEEIVFIAGGVGITPFLSILRFLRDNNEIRKIMLIWGIRIQEEMIFESEFEEFKNKIPSFAMIHILSEDDNWAGECGFIDRDRLDRFVPCETPYEAEQKKDVR